MQFCFIQTRLWGESCVYYGGLANYLDQSKTNISIDNDINIKHFIFIIQLVGRYSCTLSISTFCVKSLFVSVYFMKLCRLASVFYGHFEHLYAYRDVFKKQIEVGKSILHELIKVLICSKEYYFVKYPQSIVQA